MRGNEFLHHIQNDRPFEVKVLILLILLNLLDKKLVFHLYGTSDNTKFNKLCYLLTCYKHAIIYKYQF